jgi:hypothetical protein
VEDYSNFSWEKIQQSLKESIERIQRETGASDTEMAVALSEVAQDFMNMNFLKEPK